MAGQDHWKKVKGEWVNTLPKTRGRNTDLDTDKRDTHKEGMGKAKRRKYNIGGFIARGCGKVMNNRRKTTKCY